MVCKFHLNKDVLKKKALNGFSPALGVEPTLPTLLTLLHGEASSPGS